MLQVQFCALVLRTDDLHAVDEFLGVWIVEQERKVFRRLIGQPAAARLFPRQMFIVNLDRMTGPGKFGPAQGPRRSATDNDNFRHSCLLATQWFILRRGGTNNTFAS